MSRAGCGPVLPTILVRLHESRRTPHIAIESLHHKQSSAARQKLNQIFPIPRIVGVAVGDPGFLGSKVFYERFSAADGRADSNTQDGETDAGSGVEEEVQRAFCLGSGGLTLKFTR
jgi:hypothetical protein